MKLRWAILLALAIASAWGVEASADGMAAPGRQSAWRGGGWAGMYYPAYYGYAYFPGTYAPYSCAPRRPYHYGYGSRYVCPPPAERCYYDGPFLRCR